MEKAQRKHGNHANHANCMEIMEIMQKMQKRVKRAICEKHAEHAEQKCNPFHVHMVPQCLTYNTHRELLEQTSAKKSDNACNPSPQ